MKDLMLDIETLSSSVDAVVVQIGACYFDRHNGDIGDKFKTNIDINSCLREGFTIDGETLKWWFTEQINNATFWLNTVPVREAIPAFASFAKGADKIWSHSTFDFSIIMNCHYKLGIKPKISYRSARDIRTLIDLSGIEFKNRQDSEIPGVHDALSDCIRQVEYCVEAMKRIVK